MRCLSVDVAHVPKGAGKVERRDCRAVPSAAGSHVLMRAVRCWGSPCDDLVQHDFAACGSEHLHGESLTLLPIALFRQESDKEAEVAEALFDLANMFEKAETVLEGEEAGTSKGSLRVRGKQGATGAHRATAHHLEEAPQANGRGGYGRGQRDADARRPQAAAEAKNGGAAPHPAPPYDPAGHAGAGGQRNGEALPRELNNPWDPRNLQSLGLLPGGKANGLLGLSGFPPQMPGSLAGFYPPPSPAAAAAQLAAWPGVYIRPRALP